MATLNMDRVHEFMGKVVTDLGGAMSAPMVILGDRLGLYKAMAEAGAKGVTSAELADKTRTHERYVREWLINQAAGGYIDLDKSTGRYSIDAERAAALADDTSPCHVPGGFYVAASMVRDIPKAERAFRTGEGIDWGEHDADLFCGTELFFSSSYRAFLVDAWLPALDGVVDKLKRGATVCDVGCGHGASTVIMARAFPKSKFIGVDLHQPSIERACATAAKFGVADHCTFEIGRAKDYNAPPGSFDLICYFDCLQDMGDPVGATRNARRMIKPDGTVMVVEPNAADTVADNLNPVGRVFSAASTMICCPCSIKAKGPALGAVAGEKRLAAVLHEGGFTRVRKATETPFNMILEARA
jgi:2-polyprenyl-3-methyl-5-hydroxy-6-metoxy-1,4-benzoquinol methylase